MFLFSLFICILVNMPLNVFYVCLSHETISSCFYIETADCIVWGYEVIILKEHASHSSGINTEHIEMVYTFILLGLPGVVHPWSIDLSRTNMDQTRQFTEKPRCLADFFYSVVTNNDSLFAGLWLLFEIIGNSRKYDKASDAKSGTFPSSPRMLWKKFNQPCQLSSMWGLCLIGQRCFLANFDTGITCLLKKHTCANKSKFNSY